MIKTYFMFVELSNKLISDKFFGVKIDFRFRKKSEQLALMYHAKENFSYRCLTFIQFL